MKTLTYYLVASIVAVGLGGMPVHAAGNAGQFFVESPDHPRTWVAGASIIHQALRWDAQKGVLFADVKYSTRDWADDVHPAQENDYSLAFPNVRFDANSGRLTEHGMTIGTMRHGMFGFSEVVLSPGVQLSVHRHDGKINAMIVPGGDE